MAKYANNKYFKFNQTLNSFCTKADRNIYYNKINII